MDELRFDAHAAGRALHTTLEHVADLELARDLRGADVLALERLKSLYLHAVSREHGDIAEVGDDVFASVWLKYSCSGSPLMFRNGSARIESCGSGAALGGVVDGARVAPVAPGGRWWTQRCARSFLGVSGWPVSSFQGAVEIWKCISMARAGSARARRAGGVRGAGRRGIGGLARLATGPARENRAASGVRARRRCAAASCSDVIRLSNPGRGRFRIHQTAGLLPQGFDGGHDGATRTLSPRAYEMKTSAMRQSSPDCSIPAGR